MERIAGFLKRFHLRGAVVTLPLVIGGAVGFRFAEVAGLLTGAVTGMVLGIAFILFLDPAGFSETQPNTHDTRRAGRIAAVALGVITLFAALFGGWDRGWIYAAASPVIAYLLFSSLAAALHRGR